MVHFDCESCGTNHWLGSTGTCNSENNTCICPEGFSGKDDWLSFSSCQVNEDMRRYLHLVLAFLSIVGLVTCVVCFFLLARKWKFTLTLSSKINTADPGTSEKFATTSPNDDNVLSGEYSSLFSPPTVRSKKFNPSIKALVRRNWQRKQYTLKAVLFFMLYFIGGILYNFPALDGANREDEPVLISVGLALCVLGAHAGGALIILVWFYSLPDVSKFGGILKINRFLIRYPNFIPKTLFWKTIINASILMTLVLVAPLSSAAPETQQTVDLVVIAIFILSPILDGSLFLLTMSTVEQVFGLTIATFDQPSDRTNMHRERSAEVEFMKLAMKPIRIAKINSTVVMIFNVVLQTINFCTGGSQTYFFINISFALFCIFLISAPVGFVLLDEYLTPKALKQGLRPSDPATP